MKLTVSYIRKAIAKDKRFDQNIDVLEDGDVVAVWLKDGWTWNALDGNRHVEHFNLDERFGDVDDVAYWKHAVAGIEKEI